MARAYLGLGSNLGDRSKSLREARIALAEHSDIEILQSSSLYESEPVGGPPGQDSYINAVIAIETTLCPQDLLGECQNIEARFGRERKEHWGPRTLDIDILFYSDSLVMEPELEIPHPRLHQRAFVLTPLNELAPELLHPRLGRSIHQLLLNLKAPELVRLFSEIW